MKRENKNEERKKTRNFATSGRDCGEIGCDLMTALRRSLEAVG